jgi:predicted transcriptional regulator
MAQRSRAAISTTTKSKAKAKSKAKTRTKTRTKPTPKSKSKSVWGPLQWRVLNAPVRFELFTLAEGAAPCSIADLARLSGRRAPGLYRHVRELERAGFLVAVDRRRAGRRFETVWGLGPMAFARPIGEPMKPGVAPLFLRMVERAHRDAARDVRRAMRDGAVPRMGSPLSPIALLFETTWLDAKRRAEHHALQRAIGDLVRRGREARTGRLYRVVSSIVLVPRCASPSRASGTSRRTASREAAIAIERKSRSRRPG